MTLGAHPWLEILLVAALFIVLHHRRQCQLDDARERLDRRRRIEQADEDMDRIIRDVRSAHTILEHRQVMADVDELAARRNTRPAGNVVRLYDREDDRPVA